MLTPETVKTAALIERHLWYICVLVLSHAAQQILGLKTEQKIDKLMYNSAFAATKCGIICLKAWGNTWVASH